MLTIPVAWLTPLKVKAEAYFLGTTKTRWSMKQCEDKMRFIKIVKFVALGIFLPSLFMMLMFQVLIVPGSLSSNLYHVG